MLEKLQFVIFILDYQKSPEELKFFLKWLKEADGKDRGVSLLSLFLALALRNPFRVSDGR